MALVCWFKLVDVADWVSSNVLCMVDISHLPAGRYTVKVTTDYGVQYRTVVK